MKNKKVLLKIERDNTVLVMENKGSGEKYEKDLGNEKEGTERRKNDKK